MSECSVPVAPPPTSGADGQVPAPAAPRPRHTRSVGGAAVTLLATLLLLYFARGVFIPVALAALAALALAPAVVRFEKWGFRPGLAAGIVTCLATGIVVLVGWAVMAQVGELAERLPQYRRNIVEKTASIAGAGRISETWLAVRQIGEEIATEEAARTGADEPATALDVQVVQPPLTPLRALVAVLTPVAHFLGVAMVVVVLTMFLLAYRRNLSDRVVHVFGRTRVHLTHQAMEEAAAQVSRYIRATAIVNVAFGVVVTLGLLAIGIPNALLWGVLAGLLRFIPYAGVWLASIPPVLLALGMSESWTRPLVLVGFFIVVETILSYVIEPLVYGSGTVVSPFGVVLGALVWAVLWGPAGLILAVPLTVATIVVAKALPRLAFLDVMIGCGDSLEPRVQLYHRLLAVDSDAALALLDTHRKDREFVEILDDLVLPALALSEADRHAGRLDESRESILAENARTVVGDLCERGGDAIPPQPQPPIVLVPATDEADENVASLLAECLARRGLRAERLPSGIPPSEAVRRIADSAAAPIVCVSALPPGTSGSVRWLLRRIRTLRPDARIVVAVWSSPVEAAALAERLPPKGDVPVVSTMAEAVERVAALAATADADDAADVAGDAESTVRKARTGPRRSPAAPSSK